MPRDPQKTVEQSLKYSHDPLDIGIGIDIVSERETCLCIRSEWESGGINCLSLLCLRHSKDEG
jgi:hypothetical protein